MSQRYDEGRPAASTPDYTVVINGVTHRIAPDERQPGGQNRSEDAFRVLGAVMQSTKKILERDAERD